MSILSITTLTKAQQKTSLFVTAKSLNCVNKESSIPQSLWDCASCDRGSSVFSHTVSLRATATASWYGTGENPENSRDVSNETCRWLPRSTSQRLIMWPCLDDRVVEKFRLSVVWRRRGNSYWWRINTSYITEVVTPKSHWGMTYSRRILHIHHHISCLHCYAMRSLPLFSAVLRKLGFG